MKEARAHLSEVATRARACVRVFMPLSEEVQIKSSACPSSESVKKSACMCACVDVFKRCRIREAQAQLLGVLTRGRACVCACVRSFV